MGAIEQKFVWTVSKLLGYIVVFMGFTLELILIICHGSFELKVFLGSVAAATILTLGKQSNDTARIIKGE
jgi:hypothetical protein